MTDSVERFIQTAHLGAIEPHAILLNIPPSEQPLYKIMKIVHLVSSIEHSSLHFNRVDAYSDFPGADPHDGQQLVQDHAGNLASKFERSTDFSAVDYYNQSRSRTYAFCLSLENSPFIWTNYGNGSQLGKVGIVFHFEKFRQRLNRTLSQGGRILQYGEQMVDQIFSINYGLVKYISWLEARANEIHLPNPIRYIYLKDLKYSKEREFRISMSALGLGQFVLADGSALEFPSALKIAFNFHAAIKDGTIIQFVCDKKLDVPVLKRELARFAIAPKVWNID